MVIWASPRIGNIDVLSIRRNPPPQPLERTSKYLRKQRETLSGNKLLLKVKISITAVRFLTATRAVCHQRKSTWRDRPCRRFHKWRKAMRASFFDWFVKHSYKSCPYQISDGNKIHLGWIPCCGHGFVGTLHWCFFHHADGLWWRSWLEGFNLYKIAQTASTNSVAATTIARLWDNPI